MKTATKNRRSLVQLIDGLVHRRALEPGQATALKEAAKALLHACDVRDVRGVRKAIDTIARTLLKQEVVTGIKDA